MCYQVASALVAGLAIFPASSEQVAQSSSQQQVQIVQAASSAPASAPASRPSLRPVKDLNFHPRDLVMLTQIDHYTQVKFRSRDADFDLVEDNKALSISLQGYSGSDWEDIAEIKVAFYESDKNLDSALRNIAGIIKNPQRDSKTFAHGRYIVWGLNSRRGRPEEYLTMGWYHNILFAAHTIAKPGLFVQTYLDSLVKASGNRQVTNSLPVSPSFPSLKSAPPYQD